MFKNLKLRSSILLGFAMPIMVFLVAASSVILRVQDSENATLAVNDSSITSETALQMQLAANSMIRGVRGYILTQRSENKETVLTGNRDFQILLEKAKTLVKDHEQQERLNQLQTLQKALFSIIQQELSLVDQGKVDSAVEMVKSPQVVTAWTNFNTVMSAFLTNQQRFFQERADVQSALLAELRTIAWVSCLVATIMALFLGLWSAERITQILKDSVSALASSSAEISATVEQHERTVLQQTASVSQTTATSEELRVSAQTSSDQAENAAMVVKKALKLAEEGKLSSGKASEGMSDLQDKVRAVAEQILQLSEQAGQIGVIAKVVGDLASETNMLALNAAVEAARAGDNGKGFAVVASEVRKLADESKKSAERANALVSEIQKATNSAVMVAEAGRKMAAQVFDISMQNGEIFQELSSYASMIDQNAQQVVLNSRQQAGALSQISDAMKNLNDGAIEMAAGTRQTKLGLQNLTDVASNLKSMV